MTNYGWCGFCKLRIGEKKFRQILVDKCIDCVGFFGEPSVPDTHVVEKKKIVRKKRRTSITPLDPEEEAMLAWLRSQPVMKAYWQRAAASELDWSILKIRRVAGRLRNRKIWTFSKTGLNDGKIILESLIVPKTANQLALELPFDKSWISEILRNLEKQGLVMAKKPFSKNQPYLYEVPVVENT